MQDSEMYQLEPDDVRIPEEDLAFEDQCIECGDRVAGGCGCCGSRLCVMHLETQAGFCSNFGTHELNGEIEYHDPLSEESYEVIELDESIEVTGCLIGDQFFKHPSEFLEEN